MSEMKLTDADLARLEELAGKANEGPFRPDGNNQVFRGDSEPFAFAYAVGFPTGDNQPANCEYIAAACNAAPALVAEVRRLRVRVDALEWWEGVWKHDVQGEHPMSCCEICNHSPADRITLYCSGDPWDSTQPYTVHLCRDHQGGLIGPVQDAIKKMKEELNAQVSA